MRAPLLRSVLRPVTRVLIGAIAIPIFRFILRHVFRLQEMDEELEKDLEQWFRGSLLLLAATANMEHLLFGWAMEWDWFTIGLRLLLAIGVVEAMPDQELFAVIHPGPPKLKGGRAMLWDAWEKKWDIIRGVVCQHLNRSSPVLAIMAAIFGAQVSAAHFDKMETKLAVELRQSFGTRMSEEEAARQARTQARAQVEVAKTKAWEQFTVGWVCYGLAISQYLLMGLVTSRDRAMDVLSEFDRAVAQRRRELVAEFDLEEQVDRAARDEMGEDPDESGSDKPEGTESKSEKGEQHPGPEPSEPRQAESPADSAKPGDLAEQTNPEEGPSSSE